MRFPLFRLLEKRQEHKGATHRILPWKFLLQCFLLGTTSLLVGFFLAIIFYSTRYPTPTTANEPKLLSLSNSIEHLGSAASPSQGIYNQSTLNPSNISTQPVKQVEVVEASSSTATNEKPIIYAEAYLVVDLTNNRETLENNSNTQLSPASITKLLSALIVMDNLDLTQPITIPGQCTKVGGSNLGLSAGEVWTVEELLYASLVPSASDATCSLVYSVANYANFIEALNLKAYSLGMSHTHLTNPYGFDDSNHFSTAHDLILLGKKVLENPELKKIVGTRIIFLHNRSIISTNKLLGQQEGVYGIKTGSTEEAGQCLLFAIERSTNNYIGVILGSQDRFTESKKIINYLFSGE